MDCTPSNDTLYFNYVFGSEEYPEFVNSVNDIFGIFITGPNPAGGNYVALNFGTLPIAGNPYVSINNVNNGMANAGPCMNCGFYVDNTGDTMIRYDGVTTNIMATIPVAPNTTYHLKIAISDAGDCIYDSGVFLQAGSFRCSTITALNEHSTNGAIDVFPSPAATSVNIRGLENEQTTSVRIYNLQGALVLFTETDANKEGVIQLNISAL